MSTATPPVPRDAPTDRSLERAMLFNFLIHGVAMVGMALVLAPMIPGGGQPDDALRVAEIAAHPWRFRAGWLPWQLCAVADLWMAVAMVRARWIPRIPALLMLLLTVAAVIPDQGAQALWVTRGVAMAQEIASAADLQAYLSYEAALLRATASTGALLYTLAALGWTLCFARAGTWSRALSWLSVPTWGTMSWVTAAFLLPESLRPSPEQIAVGNAVGFTLMQLWLGLVTEQVLRRRRPTTAVGRDAPWRHPRRGLVGRALDLFSNSRLFGALLEPVPALPMTSEITDVVYVSYLVPAARLEALVPDGLELQRLGPRRDHALFTFLSFQHHHFGPRRSGPLRRLMPSPVQTNWRVHVRDPRTGAAGIFFVTNAMTSTLQAIAARMLTEGMPMHVLARGELGWEPDGTLRLSLDPGRGSAPDAEARLRPASEIPWEGAWRLVFPTLKDFLIYCVPQDRAMSTQSSAGTVTRQEIHLGISIACCEPMLGEVRSRAAAALVGDAAPVCFRVPRVAFQFETEEKDPLLRPPVDRAP